MENRTIENISRYISIAILLGILFACIYIARNMQTKEDIQQTVSQSISDEFAIQELKGNVWTDF